MVCTILQNLDPEPNPTSFRLNAGANAINLIARFDPATQKHGNKKGTQRVPFETKRQGAYFIVGMTKLEPSFTPVGQRDVTVFTFV